MVKYGTDESKRYENYMSLLRMSCSALLMVDMYVLLFKLLNCRIFTNKFMARMNLTERDGKVHFGTSPIYTCVISKYFKSCNVNIMFCTYMYCITIFLQFRTFVIFYKHLKSNHSDIPSVNTGLLPA